MQWSKPTSFTVPTANQNPGVKFKEEGVVQEFVIDNRGPGNVYFSSVSDVTALTGQRLAIRERWIEDTCAHEGELYFTADVANTVIVYKAKA